MEISEEERKFMYSVAGAMATAKLNEVPNNLIKGMLVSSFNGLHTYEEKEE